MSSHAAFRPDSDLLPRAADGDGAAALALLERHGAQLWQQAVALSGDSHRARAALVATFASLLTGAATPAPGAGLEWLQAALSRQAAALGGDPTTQASEFGGDARLLQGEPTRDEFVAALAEALPAPQRAALLSAYRADEAPWEPPLDEVGVSLRPAAPVAPVFAEYAPPTPEDLRRAVDAGGSGAGQRVPGTRGRSLDRYIERPTPLRWIAPLALVATLVALWSWWQLSERAGLDAPFPDPRPPVEVVPTAPWPTLPPRATRVIARQEPTPAPTETPTPTATPTLTVATATARPAPSPTATQPPAVVAVAPTATKPPPPPAPPPTATSAPTATRPPAPTPTPRPPIPTPTQVADPPSLVLATQNLGFGVEVGPRTLDFANPGGTPLTWRVVADSTWIELAQVSGTLPPGGTQSVPITIARGDLPTGGYNGALQIISDGGEALVPVTMAVSPSNTTISAFAAPTASIGALGCADPTTHAVSAAIGGNRPPRKATLYFALNSGTQQTKDLTVEGGGRYSAVLGPFTEAGTVLYSLVITEADGTVVRSASYSLQVTGCPTQVQTVPVVPPVTQPFALNGGGRTIYTFAVTQPGTLQVTLRWKGGTQRLSTLLYGPRHADQPFEQRTGVGTLTWSFPVTEEDVAAGGTWALHLVNYEAGEATGTFELTSTPLGQPLPTVPAGTPTATPQPATPAVAPTRPALPGTPGTPRPATPTGTPAKP